VVEPGSRKNEWLGAVIGFLLGTLAAGIAINLVSNNVTTAVRVVFAALALAAALAVAWWLKNLPERAPLVRRGTQTLLTCALVAVLVSAIVPPPVRLYVLGGAVVFTIAGLLVLTEHGKRMTILAGLAGVGLGVAAVALGVGWLLDRNWPAGVTGVVAGVVIVGFGVWLLLDLYRPDDQSDLRSRVEGPVRSWTGEPSGPPLVVLLLWAFLSYLMWLAVQIALVMLVAVGAGVALIGFGVALLLARDWLAGATLVGAGVALIGFGVVWLHDQGWLAGATLVGAGVALAGSGVALLHDRNWLAGTALLGLGVAAVWAGLALALPTPEGTRLRRWLAKLTQDPDNSNPQPSVDPSGEIPGR
jgi:hypothetical protein